MQLTRPQSENHAGPEDQFFGQPLQTTDWTEVLSHVGELNLDTLISEIQKRERLQKMETQNHEIWVLQQKIRLLLKHQKGKALTSQEICPECGTHQQDPIFYHKCLACQEKARQLPDTGSRGSCWFLKPCYDPTSQTWGLLQYESHHPKTFMGWAVLGFASRVEAQLSLRPIQLYTSWLDQRYRGLYNDYGLVTELVPMEITMTAAQPLTPQQLETMLRTNIRKHMHQQHDIIGHTISRALEEK